MNDVFIGLIPALGWGFQGIVMQKLGGRPANKQMGMSLVALAFALVVVIVQPPQWTTALLVSASLNGLAWSIGQFFQIRAFEVIGLARAMPISTGMQLVGAALVGVLVFGEWQHSGQFLLGIPALALIIAGVFLTTFQENRVAGRVDMRAGLLFLVVSSAGFVLYASSGKIFHIEGWDVLGPQAVMMCAGTWALSSLTSRRQELATELQIFGRATRLNLVTGVLFAVANVAMLISVQRNGLAVGWTLSQMNVIISTLGGLIFLKEHKTRRELMFVLSGLAMVAVGGVLIGATKS